ncbi:MAG: rhodanese-like domain-containing protein [Thermomicrobiales bacterium]|nr:rhodanese-like domain-containing protein [Thermomicrobiales bacterium]
MPITQRPDEPFFRIDVDDAKRLIDEGKLRIVDVREPAEYAGDHLANAELIPLNSFLRNPSRVEGSGILFVCEMGQRSAVASEMAAAAGLEEVYNLEGGMNAWRSKGFPVER